jgi:MSHA biogenesis protein MshM
MYTKYFGLNTLPFENVPDPAFFFAQGDYHRILEEMRGFVNAERGLMVVAGPVGSGKTTLSHKLMTELPDRVRLIWMAEPPETSIELFLFLNQELGLKPSSSGRAFIIKDMREYLIKLKEERNTCLVIIDESHLMSDDVINGIRILNNLEAGASKLIQIILIGQEEFMDKISRPEFEAFKQRIAHIELIGRINGDRVREYITHRLEIAGAKNNIFSDTGIGAVKVATGGIPRLINSLCHRALTVSCEREKKMVDMEDVDEAAQMIGLGRETFRYMTKVNVKEKERQIAHKQKENNLSETQDTQKESPHQNERQHSTPIKNKEKSNVAFPLLVLLSSIVTLAFSFLLYCKKLGFPDSLTCIEKLFQNLFFN